MSFKNGLAFVKKHPEYNAIIHASGGIALGLIISYYVNPTNPVLWIGIFLVIAIVGHLYAMTRGKK